MKDGDIVEVDTTNSEANTLMLPDPPAAWPSHFPSPPPGLHCSQKTPEQEEPEEKLEDEEANKKRQQEDEEEMTTQQMFQTILDDWQTFQEEAIPEEEGDAPEHIPEDTTREELPCQWHPQRKRQLGQSCCCKTCWLTFGKKHDEYCDAEHQARMEEVD